MKTLLLAIGFSLCASAAYADKVVELSQVPRPVTTTIEEYFPKSKLLTAKTDTDKGKTNYEVTIQYKAIQVEIEVTPEGKIIDLDMNN